MDKILDKVKVTQILTATAAVSADANLTAVDLKGYDSCAFGVDVGVDSALAAGHYWSLELEESDDNSSFTDVATTDMNTTTGTASTSGQFALIDSTDEDAVLHLVEYLGDKRYVRVVLNETGTCSGPMCVFCIRSGYKYPPVS